MRRQAYPQQPPPPTPSQHQSQQQIQVLPILTYLFCLFRILFENLKRLALSENKPGGRILTLKLIYKFL